MKNDKKRFARQSSWLVIALCLALAPCAVCAAANYTITDLGFKGGYGAYAINNSGQVTGNSSSAFVFSAGQFTTLYDSDYSSVAINSKGDVSGFSTSLNADAIVWSAGGSHSFAGRLDPYEGGGMAINTNGDVAGGDPYYDVLVQSAGAAFASHASLYTGGTLHDLGTLGGDFGLAQGINDNGQIVGQSDTTSARHAFVVNGGPMQDLNSLTSPASPWVLISATAINGSGQITGFGTVNGQGRAFVYNGGAVTDIGVVPGFIASAGASINSSGQVVGMLSTFALNSYSYGFSSPFTAHALLYSGGTTYDLNSLIDPSSHWLLRQATGINDTGQIVGWGEGPGGAYHGFLLTPVPEPSGVILAAIGLVGLMARVCRARSRRVPAPRRG